MALVRERAAWIFLAVASFGFLDALYLTVEHYVGGVHLCSLLNFNGCEVVTTSVYAALFGIPIALFGALYYLTVIASAGVYLYTESPKALTPALLLAPAGFAVSLGLVFIQLFILEAICLFCMGSAVSSTLLFGTALWYWGKASRYSNILENTGISYEAGR